MSDNCKCERLYYTNDCSWDGEEEIYTTFEICVDCGSVWEDGKKSDEDPYTEDTLMPLSYYREQYENER